MRSSFKDNFDCARLGLDIQCPDLVLNDTSDRKSWRISGRGKASDAQLHSRMNDKVRTGEHQPTCGTHRALAFKIVW